MPPPGPRVVFFDIGHTLVTGAEGSPRQLLAARLGLTEDEKARAGRLIMTCPAEDPEDLARHIAAHIPRLSLPAVRETLAALWREQRACALEIPGALAALRALRGAGLRLGVISNIWHPFFEGFLAACPGVETLLDHVVLSYRVGEKKPSPALYREALRRAGEPPEHCWMVGDTFELDMAPAARCGMKTLWVLVRPEKEREALARLVRREEAGPDWAVSSVSEVSGFFTGEGRR